MNPNMAFVRMDEGFHDEGLRALGVRVSTSYRA